jgi:DNA-directed RNA polymerase specialized sigma24 family protein
MTAKVKEFDLTIYTKKGVLRKRKQKKNKNYFTQDTEDAIIKFVSSEDQDERNKIYREQIHYAFTKLTENLIHTYKYYYTDNHSVEELQHNAIIFLLERLKKFQPGKGKAYSYFGTIAKRYFIFNNAQNYKKLQTHSNIEEINDENELDDNLVVNQFEENNLSHFFDQYVKFIELHSDQLFTKTTEKQVADCVLVLFKNRENLDIFNKKAFYIFIKEMIDVDTNVITKVIKRMKTLYIELYNEYTIHGYIKKLS